MLCRLFMYSLLYLPVSIYLYIYVSLYMHLQKWNIFFFTNFINRKEEKNVLSHRPRLIRNLSCCCACRAADLSAWESQSFLPRVKDVPSKLICFTPQSKHTIIKVNDSILQELENTTCCGYLFLYFLCYQDVRISRPIKFS